MDIIQRITDFLASLRAEAEPDATERSMPLSQMAEQIYGQIESVGMSAGAYPSVHDFYAEEDGSLSVVFSVAGRLYKAPVTMTGTTAVMGSLTEVEPMFSPVRSLQIVRQADGTLRWLAVAAAAVLNRVGEIDSRALFDSFIANVKTNGYPQLRFYHDARMVLGKADWVDRADNLYIASGTLDAGPLADGFVDAIETQRGVWGCSIGFLPTKAPQMVEVVNGIAVPVYQAGVNTEISVLPEDSAASWFTEIGLEVTRNMDEAKLKALATLLGDEDKAKQFAAGIDATNRAIEDKGMITRQETPAEAAPVAEAAPEPAPETEERHATTDAEKEAKAKSDASAQSEADLIAKVMEKVNASFEGRLTKLEEALTKMAGKEAERMQERSNLDTRLVAVETVVTRWQETRQADMPPLRTLSATYRPREQAAAPPGKLDLAAVADQTMSKITSK